MEHLINLNFAPGGLPAVIHVSQYDDTLRQLKFQLWFGRSKVEVPSGAAVRVDIKKPDGHIVLVSGTVDTQDRSIVTVPTTKQMTAAPGGARGMLVVTGSGDKRISSALFVLQVHRDPVEDGDASDSDLSMLQDAIDQTAANATAAQQAASSFTTDPTLSVSGKAADAKKTGDEISAIKADLDDANKSLGTESKYSILLNDEVPNTTQEYTFSQGKVSQIVHSRNSVAIRTDAFTYGSGTITEVRTLSTGESLTIVTDLETLETTVTYTED